VIGKYHIYTDTNFAVSKVYKGGPQGTFHIIGNQAVGMEKTWVLSELITYINTRLAPIPTTTSTPIQTMTQFRTISPTTGTK
jgi:hypothetical protein